MFSPIKHIQYKRRYGKWSKADRTICSVIKKNIKKSDHVLEMGSSTGHISFMLVQNGYRIDCLDIRDEPIRAAENYFKSANLDSRFFVEDILAHKTRYDAIWNSGLLSCYPPPDQEKVIRHLSRITKKLLLFCPDTDHSKAPNTGDGIPGVGDAREYSVANIPIFLYENFFLIKEGVMTKKNTALPFNYIWYYASHKI